MGAREISPTVFNCRQKCHIARNSPRQWHATALPATAADDLSSNSRSLDSRVEIDFCNAHQRFGLTSVFIPANIFTPHELSVFHHRGLSLMVYDTDANVMCVSSPALVFNVDPTPSSLSGLPTSMSGFGCLTLKFPHCTFSQVDVHIDAYSKDFVG